MATKAQIAANRSNARQSTGPTSPEGKGKVARNALRHGLSVPVSSLRDFDKPVERLAELLVGSSDNAVRREGAHAVAESVIEWVRIRSVKLTLLRQAQQANFGTGFAQFCALERYERRALSKRKFAIRRFHGGD